MYARTKQLGETKNVEAQKEDSVKPGRRQSSISLKKVLSSKGIQTQTFLCFRLKWLAYRSMKRNVTWQISL